MKWGKLLGAAATVAGTVVGGPAGAAVAVGIGALTGGAVAKDVGKKQAKRVQNVAAPTAAMATPAMLALIPGVDFSPVVLWMAKIMEVVFGCTVVCPDAVTGSQQVAAAGLMGLLMSATHQGVQNVQKSRLPQK